MTYEMTRDEFMTAIRGYVGRTKYAKGTYGQKLTVALLDEKRRQYPEWYNAPCKVPAYRNQCTNYEYLRKFCNGRWFVADCCGLIKGVRAGYRADGTKGKMTPKIDVPIETMVAELKDVKKDVYRGSEGEMIFLSDMSHVMVVSEQGAKDIESAPSCDGVKEVNIGYQPVSLIGGVGKLPWVDYSGEVKPIQLEVDGLWGTQTTRRAQQFFGTEQDGVVSRQLPRFKSRCAACVSGWHWNGCSGDVGSDLIRAMQKWLCVDVDGHIGTQTISALQRRMGTFVDGVLSYPSDCVKAFQRFLNEQEK